MDPIASPGDPIFYLHHTWLDKIWWEWQAMDLPRRLTDMGGRNTQDGSEGFPGAPPNFNGPNGAKRRSPADGPILIFPGDGGNIDWDEIDWEKIGFPGLGGGNGGPIQLPPGVDVPPEALEPPEDAEPQEPRGDPGDVTTLNHVLKMFGLVPDALIRDVMDIAGGTLCYEYV